MPDRRPRQQREAAEARERVLLLETSLKMLKADAAEDAAADAAAAETHPQKKPTARYRYPTMDKTLGNFRLHVVEGEITDAQIIVVLGNKGTGKSTFLRMLAGTVKPDADVEMPNFNVSYKPQNFPKNKITSLSCGTVGNLLQHRIPNSLMNPEFVSNVMEPLYINLLMDKLVKDLSPRLFQSVALCLCLGKPADIYLIDVPSAYLGPEQRVATAQVIKWFIRHEKKAAVVVEHDFIMAFQLAHGYIVIEGEPLVDCTANGPVSVLAGGNHYLTQLNKEAERFPVELWLDLMKLEYITECREQRAVGSSSSSSYYDEIFGET